MDKYDEMLLLFYRTGRWNDWNPFLVKHLLQQMDSRGQLLEERNESGELDAFLAWLMVPEEELHRLNVGHIPLNGGDAIVPVFGASRQGYRGMKEMGRTINRMANGNLWSWRRNRLLKVGKEY